MLTHRKFSVFEIATVALLVIGSVHQAPAGLVNNYLRIDGYGRVGINFVFSGITNTVKTSTNGVPLTLIKNGLLKAPYALIGTPPPGLTPCTNTYGSCSDLLPPGTPLGNFYYVRSSGALFSISNLLTGGASADNAELESRFPVVPAECVSASLEANPVITGAHTGNMEVNGQATAGSALWLRCYEFPGTLPADDPETTVDESLEFLKANGSLKYDLITAGPFNFNAADCTTLRIPFNFENQDNLYFLVDTLARSLPLVISCPAGIEVFCTNSFAYPAVQYAGCGEITVSYNPPAPAGGTFPAGSFPVGVTPVTVTATDKYGNSTNCTFTVTVKDNTPPVIPSLPNLTGESSVTVAPPAGVTDNCGGTVKITTTDPLVYNTQGTFTVRWTFDDNHGNITTSNQIVIVDDSTAPTPPVLATITGQCSATVTAPTAMDSVVGSVIGTTSDPLVYNSQGTFTVRWTFNDGNGNSSTADQTVIVKDTIQPAAPVLATATGSCSAPVTLTAPSTTDNCAGIVTGATTNSLVYSSAGTFTVHWTFNDGNGNSSTATQTVIVTGLTFDGFFAPINGTGGTCATPLRSITLGSKIPVKFTASCGGSPLVTGRPTLSLQQCSGGSYVGGGDFEIVGNDWHFNWDTTGRTKGVYEVIARLQDGTTRTVFIRLK